MPKYQPWLKMWVEWVDDPKMLSLTMAEQGAWWRLCTLAKKCAADGVLVKGNGSPLSLDEVANAIRITTRADRRDFDSMVKKMLDQDSLHWNSNALIITHFAERQAKTSSETPEALRGRQQRRRQKLWEDYGIKDSSIPKETRRLVIERDECRCQLCGKQGTLPSPEATVVLDPEDNSPFEFDHIIPKSQGGSEDPDNLRLSCRKCNRARGTKPSPLPLRTPSPNNTDKDTDKDIEERRDKSVTNLYTSLQKDFICAEVSKLYEENIGFIKPALADEIRDFCDNFHGPVAWVSLAFKEALSRNKKSWHYIQVILENWEEKGGPDDKSRQRSKRGERADAVKRDPLAGARESGWEVVGGTEGDSPDHRDES